MEANGSAADKIALEQVTASTVAAVDPRLQSNAAAVVFDDFIVAIDAGMRPFAARLFRETLESAYHRPVRLVCVTHVHADHTFGLTAFRDVPIVASRQLAVSLERSTDFSPEVRAARKQTEPDGGAWLDEVELVMPSLLIYGRMDVACGGKVVEFHHSGGHTDCSVYGYLSDEKVLFAGDLIFAGMFPFAGDDTADPEVWMSTLRTWLDMNVDHVIPGHGPVSGREEISGQLEFLEALKKNTLEALRAGRAPADIVLPTLRPVSEDKKWFAEKSREHWHAYYRGWS